MQGISYKTTIKIKFKMNKFLLLYLPYSSHHFPFYFNSTPGTNILINQRFFLFKGFSPSVFFSFFVIGQKIGSYHCPAVMVIQQ